jgi:hypothetical protein
LEVSKKFKEKWLDKKIVSYLSLLTAYHDSISFTPFSEREESEAKGKRRI